MTADLFDLFFSFRGRIGRRAWAFGLAAIGAVALAGTALFNADGFDESANAVRGAPTVAAFLWAFLCLVAATALSAKRLADRCRPPWFVHTLALPATALLAGWGLGLFRDPLALTLEAAAFWGLAALLLPALLECAAPTAPPAGRR